MIDNKIIKHLLWSSYGKDTAHHSVSEKWHTGNRFIGQCSITALLIQNIMGGEIIKANATNYGFFHYWNQINGIDIDFTYEQFDIEPVFIDKIITSSDKILSNYDTKKRYYLLKERFDFFLEKYKSIENQVTQCVLCTKIDHFNHNSIYFGNNCSLLFIGEAPAKNGWKITGKAWINEKGNIIPSGKNLQKLLKNLNIDLFDITFTEAIKCLPQNRKYLETAMNNCKYILYQQIDLLKPNIIITLGNYPTQGFLDYKNFSEVVGKEHLVKINNQKYLLIPIYHPSPISTQSIKGNIPIFNKIKERLM